MRRDYIDNMRWTTVVVVCIYHVFYIFNSVGVMGGMGKFFNTQYQDIFLYIVYPWFMVLLFLVAGVSSRLALLKKGGKEFIKTRTQKLLIPCTAGLFVYQFVMGYMNIKVGGGLSEIPQILIYPISAMSGIGPLWFIQMLWMFSILTLLFPKIDKNESFYNLCGKANTYVICAFAFIIWGTSQILNTPLITVYRFGIYFTAYILGYFVFSHESVIERVTKGRFAFLAASIFLGLVYVLKFFGSNYTEDACLKSILTNLYLWATVLAIIGVYKAYFDKTNKFSEYMSKSSYGLYILHYSVLLIISFFTRDVLKLSPAFVYISGVLAVTVITLMLYEIIRRIPIYRFLVLGIKKNKK